MSFSPHILQAPSAHAHYVQFGQQDSGLLTKNVAEFLAEGLHRLEGALVIATPEHWGDFVSGLEARGVDTSMAIRSSRLLWLDAVATLGQFMLDDRPDWRRFASTLRAEIKRLAFDGRTGFRAYGEMVGLLWASGQYSAAVRLEEFWNRLLQAGGFTLFCSYPIDIFSTDFRIDAVDALLCDHTHVIASGSEQNLATALAAAMDTCLGDRASSLRRLSTDSGRPWGVLSEPEAAILWLRKNLPNEAEEILSLARANYRSAAGLTTAV